VKTSRAAKLFKVDFKTIVSWTNTFSKFFSEGANNPKQRNYDPDDLILLNTIQTLRAKGDALPDIHIQLEGGYRNAALPPTEVAMGAEQTMTVYAQLKQYQAEVEHLTKALEEEKAEKKAGFQERDERIISLNREIAVLQYRLEQLETDDDK
jgi:DNA-binding transcriptional MerR regulator